VNIVVTITDEATEPPTFDHQVGHYPTPRARLNTPSQP
jgi:hypothetical protein